MVLADEKPKLLFKFDLDRRRYIRRSMWLLLAIVAVGAAWIALDYTAGRGKADERLLNAGRWIALVLGALLVVRFLINLVRGLTTKTESARFFDKGFAWKRAKQQSKYGWAQVKTFREGARTVSFAGRPLLTRGAHTLTMRDGKVYKITGRHGDTRRFAKVVRPYIADITGTLMGRALREDKSVRLNPHLILQSGGVVAGKTKIPWSQVDVKLKNDHVTILRVNAKGKFKTVRSFKASQINNLAGFMDIAESTIRNHQPDRFNIKTYGTARS